MITPGVRKQYTAFPEPKKPPTLVDLSGRARGLARWATEIIDETQAGVRSSGRELNRQRIGQVRRALDGLDEVIQKLRESDEFLLHPTPAIRERMLEMKKWKTRMEEALSGGETGLDRLLANGNELAAFMTGVGIGRLKPDLSELERPPQANQDLDEFARASQEYLLLAFEAALSLSEEPRVATLESVNRAQEAMEAVHEIVGAAEAAMGEPVKIEGRASDVAQAVEDLRRALVEISSTIAQEPEPRPPVGYE